MLQDNTGYMPKRREFDIEWDNEAEVAIQSVPAV